MPGCVITLPGTVSPKTVSKRLDLSFGIFARRGEKYSCYLFPSRTKAEGFISENTLGKIMNGMGYKGRATPHGFRALASSVLNEQGFNPDAVERQLAHVEEDRIRAAYNRVDYMDERREMMQWYADYLRERYRQALKQIQTP